LDESEQGRKPQRHRGRHANINLVRLALVLAIGRALLACGAAPAAAVGPSATPVTRGPEQPPAPASPPTGDECDALVAHAIELIERERTDDAHLPAGERANLRALADGRCREMSRPSLTCALAATSADAFMACDTAPVTAPAR
jgi:hypothetical protein